MHAYVPSTYLVTYFWCQYSYRTFYMYICRMNMKWEKQTSACECSMTLAASAIESKNRKAPVVALLHYSTPKCQLIWIYRNFLQTYEIFLSF